MRALLCGADGFSGHVLFNVQLFSSVSSFALRAYVRLISAMTMPLPWACCTGVGFRLLCGYWPETPSNIEARRFHSKTAIILRLRSRTYASHIHGVRVMMSLHGSRAAMKQRNVKRKARRF